MTARTAASVLALITPCGDFRDHLAAQGPAVVTPEARATASKCLASTARSVIDLYVTGGMDALADACHVPGGPGREEIAARYAVIFGLTAAETQPAA